MKVLIKNSFAGDKLVYFNQNGQISADLDELAPPQPKLNAEAIYDYLIFNTVLPPNSLYEGVSTLFPGEELLEEHGRLTRRNSEYAELTRLPLIRDSVKGLAARLDSMLGEYFAKAIAHDRPVALMLSGGIDSAIIASYLPKNTVCVTWAGWGEGGTDLKYARQTFGRFGLGEHLVLNVDYAQDEQIFLDALKKVRHPFSQSSGVPYLRMAQKLQEYFKGRDYQLFMGENADTIAGAYHTGVYVYYLSLVNKILHFLPIPKLLIKKHRKFFLASTRNPVELFAYFSSFGLFPGPWIHHPKGYFETKLQQILGQLGRLRNYRDHILMLELSIGSRRNQFRHNYLPSLYGAQMALPYYDKEIVKFFLQIPQHIRRQQNFGKVVLQELAARRGVSPEVIAKGKKGLSYNYVDFLRQKMHLPGWDEMEKDAELNKFVDIAAVRKIHENNFALFDSLHSLHQYLRHISK